MSIDEKTKEKFDRFFKESDVDQDGFLRIQELKTMLFKIGFKGTDEEIATMFVDLLSEGEDKVSYDHFMREMCKVPLKEVRDSDLRQLFRHFDKDNNGFVSRTEMADCIKETNMGYTEEEIQTILEKADKNNDGMVDYEEFLQALELRS